MFMVRLSLLLDLYSKINQTNFQIALNKIPIKICYLEATSITCLLTLVLHVNILSSLSRLLAVFIGLEWNVFMVQSFPELSMALFTPILAAIASSDANMVDN